MKQGLKQENYEYRKYYLILMIEQELLKLENREER